MYQTVQVADIPAATYLLADPAVAEPPPPGCSLTFAADSMAAAAAGLAVMQQAAAMRVQAAQLQAAHARSASAAGLPGLMKSWAVEAAGSVVLRQQQQQQGSAVLHLSSGTAGRLPVFTEQQTRWVQCL